MHKLDANIELQMRNLELEWRQVYENSLDARAMYEAVSGNGASPARHVDSARERLELAERLRAQTLAKTDRLEQRIFGLPECRRGARSSKTIPPIG